MQQILAKKPLTTRSRMLYNSGSNGGPFSKVFFRVKKGVINLFLCISMAYNVISCIEIAKNTQTLKIADFTM